MNSMASRFNRASERQRPWPALLDVDQRCRSTAAKSGAWHLTQEARSRLSHKCDGIPVSFILGHRGPGHPRNLIGKRNGDSITSSRTPQGERDRHDRPCLHAENSRPLRPVYRASRHDRDGGGTGASFLDPDPSHRRGRRSVPARCRSP
jgi:hypothetical protein